MDHWYYDDHDDVGVVDNTSMMVYCWVMSFERERNTSPRVWQYISLDASHCHSHCGVWERYSIEWEY